MNGTTTPISDRTDESLVRRMAELMEWIKEGCYYVGWEHHINGTLGLTVWETRDGPFHWFMPHGDIHTGAADRERVIMAMKGVWFMYWITKDGTHCWSLRDCSKIKDDRHLTLTAENKDNGRAFCEVVNMWIESQEAGA